MTGSPKHLQSKDGLAVTWRAPSGGSKASAAGHFVIEENLHYLVSVAARLMSRALNDRLTQFGVTVSQWPVLVHLWADDGLSQRELCERIGIDPGTMTRTLDGMERRGLVTRARLETNRRQHRIELSEKGAALKVPLLPCIAELIDQSTAAIDAAELATAKRVLGRIIGWGRRQPTSSAPDC